MINYKTYLKTSSSLAVRKTARRLAENKDGIAAIEFALLAPIMIIMYIGLAEISHALSVDRNVSHSANVAGDLATQASVLTKLDVEDILTATVSVMSIPPSQSGNVSIELNSYRYDDAAPGDWELIGTALVGNPIVAGGATYDPAAAGLIPKLLNATSGAVVARVNYLYTPVSTDYMQPVILHETFVLKPRRSDDVEFEDGDGTSYSCSIAANMDVTCT